ncbi:DNA dependent RNA polymerase [Xanthomonas phage XAJ24]|uniref:DNA-directed RNA polymerase n=1 Tax=Xanthomonas phage XAJ24 TaxID=1775250 RepID=A0A1I9L2A4_9CAUD|nr:DNA dependent RNA polymerase [Xanthomonas phage XAJ24]AMW36091.1 DNA dependent RNA polymerase [Xanthomonas phage XAJ24]
MLSQVELELETYSFGQERMARSIARNEEKGGADNNPYAQAVYRRFVLPLAARIEADINSPRIGRAQAHVPLLRAKFDPERKDKRGKLISKEEQGREWYEAVAYVAVRGVLTTCMRDKHGEGSDRDVLKQVGVNVYHEFLLTQFADAEPTLFYHLMNDMDRKLSVNENHRMTVMKLQAKKNGVEFTEWAQGQRDQVGAYLVDQLAQLGMVDVGVVNESKRLGVRNVARTMVRVELTAEVRSLITQISDFVIEATPFFLPCVEPPKDWTAIDNGGFHTTEMRRLNPWMVKTYAQTRDDYRASEMSNEMRAINVLQRVPWRINKRLMEAVSSIAKVHDMEEIISQGELPKPRKPEWLTKDMTKEMMSHNQETEFKRWKREVANWHTDERIRANKGNRFYNAMKVARKFAEYPSIYFVYFADFRGRKYVQTTGVSPQGSDLQKALLEFSEGKPLLTKDAQDWFCITGANRWGYDKASLPDRVKWVADHHEQIMTFAADPVNNDEWKTADKPLQFLSWCMEYEQWQVFGPRFLSRIAVGMDGSCNGLQNFSAMLRDSAGGVATNLIPAPLPNDIYQMVADRVTAILLAEDEDDVGFRSLWLNHGLTRTLVKRSVMTLPYGSKKSSWADFIVGDYLKEGKFPDLDKALHGPAARFLSIRMGDAIADTVVAAAGAMAWLQRGSTAILNQGYDRIKWITPSGFPVAQVYWESEEHRINTKLCGNAKLSIRRSTDEVKKSRHRNGIAPNFVHSLDASHLTLVTVAAEAEGITAFAMIHDDFGTHAADSAALYRIIREQFVAMYERHDVLAAFHSAYPFLPEPPPVGDLDLRQVLDSPYFFS